MNELIHALPVLVPTVAVIVLFIYAVVSTAEKNSKKAKEFCKYADSVMNGEKK